MDILRQLGGLLLGSVPTAIFFVLLVIAYSVLVKKPLDKTLAERRARTLGAVEQARGAIAAAEAETAVFEDKLRAARAEILGDRERRMKELQKDREQVLAESRKAAGARVQAAKAELEATSVTARGQVEAMTEQLGEQIVRMILPQGAAAGVRP